MAEFQWWLLIVGLVAGGGLVTLVFMDGARLESEIDGRERPAEATWISERLAAEGRDIDPYTTEAVLWAHREYLGLPPPDRIEVEGDPDLGEEPTVTSQPAMAPAPMLVDERVTPADRTRAIEPALVSDRDADGAADEERHDGSGGPDRDLPAPREEQAAAREEAHAGAHGEEAHQR